MACRLRLRAKAGEGSQGFLFVLCQHYMPRQSQHLEKLNGLIVNVGKHNTGIALLGNVDDSHQDRDADAVDELSVAEIDDERATAGIETVFAFPLNSLAGQFIQVVARVNYRRGADAMRTN